MQIKPSAPRPTQPQAPVAPFSSPAPSSAAPATPSVASGVKTILARANPYAETRGGPRVDAAQLETGISLREARRAGRAERISEGPGSGLSIRDRIHGLLDIFDGVGPASRQVVGAFEKWIDGKALDLPHWKEDVRRTILGPEYPTTPAAVVAETRRIGAQVSGPISRLSPEKAHFVDQLRSLGISDLDLFRGSHTVVQDNGALYDEWKSIGARPRTSSHYPGNPTQQYEIELPGIGVTLFGKDKHNQTWFQMEAHGTKLEELIPHMWNYVQHEVSGHQNIGPLGYSPHSEKLGNELHFGYAPQPAFT